MATTTASPPVEMASSITIKNPRTGELIYTLPEASGAEIEQAYAKARTAARSIAGLSVRQRLDECRKLKQYISENKEAIVERIVEETGKPRTEAILTEIFPSLDLIDHYEKTAVKVLQDEKHKTPLILQPKKSKVYYEPMGTVLIISPWNYPFNLSLTPIVTALIAGNAVVFKPSEHTPLKGVLEDIFEKSGFLKDVLQVVYGGKEVGRACIDQQPDKVFFTGSEAGGKAIMAHAAQYLIPVELELGGKDPMVVFEDVNLDRSVSGAVWGGMTNSGQTCTSVERIFVQESIYEKFVEQMKGEVEALISPANCGAFDDKDVDLGCMTAEFQIRKVEDQVQDAVEKGAKVRCGGSREPGSHVFAPTIITNVDPSMKIYAEETFGPVVTITPFKDEVEAIRLANDSPYGLSASVWTADLDRADRVARSIVTGNVSINNVLATQANSSLPFGGVKQSGMGRYKGAHGLYSFSNIKSIMVEKNSGTHEPIWYPYTKEKYGLVTKLVDGAFAGGISGVLQVIGVALKLNKIGKKRNS